MKLNYEFLDHSQSQTIILLHGFLSTSNSMKKIAESLSDIRNVIIVDLPGFAGTKSVGISYTMKDIASGLDDIINELNLSQVDIFGYSMGGRVALAFTVLQPKSVERLILESASAGIKDEANRVNRQQLDKDRHDKMIENYQAFLKDWQALPLFNSQQHIDPDILNQQQSERQSLNPSEAADSLLKYGTGFQDSYWDDIKSIHQPVLLMVGQEDEKFVSIGKTMSQLIKSAKLEVVESCGHNIHLEAYDVFIEILRAYLQEEDS